LLDCLNKSCPNGFRDLSEVIKHAGADIPGKCNLPLWGDYRNSLQEMMPMWRGLRLDFVRNDFAVVIDVSAVTKNGVAQGALTYPRQFARRLMVSVGAESNGVRDRDGERFALPVIVGQ
jgi:hypothetical protein